MAEVKEELHHDENTLKKVYEGLLAAGIFGQKAVDAVSEMQNQGILFRERKPKRRGRPPKTVEAAEKNAAEVYRDTQNKLTAGDAWTPKDGPTDA